MIRDCGRRTSYTFRLSVSNIPYEKHCAMCLFYLFIYNVTYVPFLTYVLFVHFIVTRPPESARRQKARATSLVSYLVITHDSHPSSFCRSRDKLEFCHSTASSRRPLSGDDRVSIDEFCVLNGAQCNLSPEVPVCKHWGLSTSLDKLSINARSVPL